MLDSYIRPYWRKAMMLMGTALLLSCSTSYQADWYRSEQPILAPEQFFNGQLQAWGMFQDRSGKVIKRFRVNLQGRWENNQLQLDEDFRYADGSSQHRRWLLRQIAPQQWQGEAADVVGQAIGETSGNTLHWRYQLALPVDGRVIDVDMDDTMVLMSADRMLNRAVMSKLGVTLGYVTISFEKPAS